MKFGNSTEIKCRTCGGLFFTQEPLRIDTGEIYPFGYCGDCETGAYTCVYCDAILVPGPVYAELKEQGMGEIVADAEAYHYETVHMGDDEEAGF